MGMAAFVLGLAVAPLVLSSAFVPSLGEKSSNQTGMRALSFEYVVLAIPALCHLHFFPHVNQACLRRLCYI